MKTKTKLLLVGLILLSAMVVFAGTAMAEGDDDCTRALHVDGYENTGNVGHHPNDEPVATITAQPGDTVTLRVDWWDWRTRAVTDCYRIYKRDGASWIPTGIQWEHRTAMGPLPRNWKWTEYDYTVTATVPNTPGTYTYRIIAMACPFADLSTKTGRWRWNNIVSKADKTWDKVKKPLTSTGDYEDITIVVCEPRIEDILNDTYGSGCWQESTVETFYATGPSSYTAKAIVAGTNCANINPTGWYVAGSTADTAKTQMWANPCDPTEGEQTIGPLGAGDSFGLYIDSDESGIMYYTETNLNPGEEIHAEVFKIICGDADFVVAFEDLPDSPWGVCEPDYNDVIIELRDASSEPIPEFATIAIPAVAVLGLFLFFNKRKHKKE